MNERTRIVFNGFLELTQSEQQEFISAVINHSRMTEVEKRLVESETKSMTRVSLGPLGNVCPCCGR